MSLLKNVLPAVKPMLKPALEEMEREIVKSLNDYPTEEGNEVAIIMVVRNDRLVIAPVIADENNNIKFSNELDEKIVKPQLLIPYLLENFKKGLK